MKPLAPLIVASLLSPLAANADSSVPPLPIRSIPIFPAQTIKADGKLDEPGWKRADIVENLVQRDGKAPNLRTTVKLFSDGKNLNVAFICADNRIAELKKAIQENDGAFWTDDSVELFFDMLGNRMMYVHFGVSASGAKYDAVGKDTHGWNPKWEAGTSVHTDHWIAEIQIPLKEISPKGFGPGDELHANFSRNQISTNESSCWSPAYGGWHALSGMGTLIFGEIRTAVLRHLGEMDEALLKSKPLAAKDPDYAPPFENATRDLENLKASLPPKPGADAYRQVLAFNIHFRQLMDELNRTRALKENRERGYVIWENPEWNLYPQRIDYSAIGNLSSKASIRVLIGQTEYRSFLVANVMSETVEFLISHDLPNTQLAFPSFVRTGDRRLAADVLMPPDNLNRLVIPAGEQREIWCTVNGKTAGEFSGNLTLTPISGSFVGTTIPLSITVEAGDTSRYQPDHYGWSYLGGAEKLGLGDAFYRAAADHHSNWITISGLRIVPRPTADDEGNFTAPLDWSLLHATLERGRNDVLNGRGQFFVSLDIWEKRMVRAIFNRKIDSTGWDTAFKRWVTAIIKELKDAGFGYEHFVINPMDESADERFLKLARLVREADPKARILCNSHADLEAMKASNLNDYVDIYMPHRSQLVSEDGQRRVAWYRSSGKPVGFYFYSEGNNEKIRSAFENTFWWLWYSHALGLRDGPYGYWSVTQLYGDAWNRHQSPKVTYDVSLIYPGNGIAIPSRRLAAWKRALEDIALLEAVEARIGSEDDLNKRTAMEATYHQALANVTGISPKSLESPIPAKGLRRLSLIKSAREIPSDTVRTARESLINILVSEKE